MQFEPYPIEMDMRVREQAKLHMIGQWQLRREAGEAREGAGSRVLQVVKGAANSATDGVRSWFTQPPKPEQQGC